MNKINNKSNIKIVFGTIVALVFFTFLGNYLLAKIKSDESKTTKISTIEIKQNETVKQSFGVATFENNSTKYADGGTSNVRVLYYYNSQVKNSIPFNNQKLNLTTVIAEWNEYDAVVASAQAAFIEKPINEIADYKSTMVGGDEESNRRIKEPSIRYWAVASKMFEQEFATLQKTEVISNRNKDYVTFDFITTNGFYTVQVKKSELVNGQSIWANLFSESKFLTTEMARVQNESAIDAQKRYDARQLKKTQQNN